ncbi:MAG: hypothetical protein QOC93_1405 [Actinomycetota bacterium]|jgi:hypothetical protein|nr:hypothetical protein [Actinomycetota bacterium]
MHPVATQRRKARFDRVRVRYEAHLAGGELTAAEVLLRQLLALSPDWAAGWFDLGLIAKLRRDWTATRDANERALALGDGTSGDPAAWNLGIAATALGDWDTARRAWATFGVELGPGEGPIHSPLGQVAIRLNPEPRRPGERRVRVDDAERGTEVVWADRLSPAHAVLTSVPLPESGHRYGDVVLHDGEPAGSRELADGTGVPVFDELARLVPATHPTTALTVSAPAAADVDALLEVVTDAGLRAEDWTGSVRALCPACSSGEVHDHTGGTDWQPERAVGIAGDPARVDGILTGWATAGPGRSWRA